MRHYLPESSRDVDMRPVILHMLQDENTIPFTEEDAKIFQAARFATWRNDNGLGVPGYVSILLFPIIFSLFAFGAVDHHHVHHITVVATGFAALIFSNLASMVFTGTWPSKASDEGNRDQNTLHRLTVQFRDVAIYMLIQYKDESKRKWIAAAVDRINMERIFDHLYESTTQKGSVKTVTKMLGDVITYVKMGTTHYNSELELILMQLGLPFGSITWLPTQSLIGYEGVVSALSSPPQNQAFSMASAIQESYASPPDTPPLPRANQNQD